MEKVAGTYFTYVGSELKTVEVNLFFNTSTVPFFKADFVYNAAGNITRQNSYIYNPTTNSMEQDGYVTMQHDNKINLFLGLGDLTLIFWQAPPKINVIKEEYFSKNGSAEVVGGSTYFLSAQGYPTKAIVIENQQSQPSSTATLLFSYKP